MYLINIIPTQREKEAQKEKTTDEYHQETKLFFKKKASKNTQPNHRPTISCHLYQKHEVTIKTPTQTL